MLLPNKTRLILRDLAVYILTYQWLNAWQCISNGSSYQILAINHLYNNENSLIFTPSCHKTKKHSVESPSMVDPQWNIWYWGSKWNLHTVCWSAVGCEWGTTSVYFGITYVCFIPSRLPVFAVEPQYLLQYFFIFVKSIIWITQTKSSKILCWFKIWMGFVRPILIKLWTSSIWGFL